jgi:hypothetical protein
VTTKIVALQATLATTPIAIDASTFAMFGFDKAWRHAAQRLTRFALGAIGGAYQRICVLFGVYLKIFRQLTRKRGCDLVGATVIAGVGPARATPAFALGVVASVHISFMHLSGRTA